MSHARRSLSLVILAVLVGLFLAGCSKRTVKVVFVNLTDETLDVDLRGPGEGTGVVGTLTGRNSRVQAILEIDKSELPATYTWSAGDFANGSFPVTPKGSEQIYVNVRQEKDPPAEK